MSSPAVGRGPAKAVRAQAHAGFTLLELLAVIALVAVLTAIVIGVGRHAAQAGKIARAKAEMAALATSLEAYKAQYGDYPQVTSDPNIDSYDSSQELYRALSGMRGPALNAPVFGTQQRVLFEQSRFRMADLQASVSSRENHFVDPWDQPYRYVYTPKNSAWKSATYVLMSAGPDETLTLPLPATGLIGSEAERTGADTDNIYANSN